MTMDRQNMKKLVFRILIISVVLLCLVGLAVYAEFEMNKNPFTEERQQIVKDRKGGSVDNSFDKKDQARKLFEEGKEYVKSRMFNEAIRAFTKLKVNHPKSKWTKRATILWGIALTERGIKNKDRRDIYQAKDKLEEIIQIYDEKPYDYSDDFTHFLLSLARVSRLLDGVNLEILNHLEEMLIYYDGYTQCQLYAEVGFIYLGMDKYKDALRWFENGCGPLATLGKIQASCKNGDREMVNVLCSQVQKYHKDYELIGDINKACDECIIKKVKKVKRVKCCPRKIYPKKVYPKKTEIIKEVKHTGTYYIQGGIHKFEHLARERSKDINKLDIGVTTNVYRYKNKNLWIVRTRANYDADSAKAKSKEIREHGMDAIPVRIDVDNGNEEDNEL